MDFHGPLRKNPRNLRYFTDDTGQAIYLTGSHTWAVMQDMWAEDEPRRYMDYDGFLQMLSDHGHNFLRFWQFSLATRKYMFNIHDPLFDPIPFERTGPGLANDGSPKFDLGKPAQAYFDRMRQRVEKAAGRGIYVSIMMFEACGLKGATLDQQPWDFHIFNPKNNVNEISEIAPEQDGLYAGKYIGMFSMEYPKILEYEKLFIRKVVDTVNDLDNVLYEICNEPPNTPQALAWQDHLCQYIHDYEKTKPKQHMVGITGEGGYQVNEQLWATSADWISPSNGRGFEYRYNPPPATGEKVLLVDTDHLWGFGCEISWIWKSFTRGLNILFMDPWEPIAGDLDWWQYEETTLNQRYYFAWDDMRRNLGYTRRIALMYDMNQCFPDLRFCTSTYCLGNRNMQYVCYFPAGGDEGLDLTGLDGEFKVEWLNPATGVLYKGKPVKAQPELPQEPHQRMNLHAPFSGPAVLLLYKQRIELPRRYQIYQPA